MNVPFHKPYITDEEINEVVDSLKSGWITMGPSESIHHVGCKVQKEGKQ